MHLNIIGHLLLLLAGARFLGRCARFVGLSPVIGEIVAGLLLGPTVLQLVPLSQELSGIIELSVFLMIFAAGFEVDLQDLFSAIRKKAIICAVVSFLFTFSVGFVLGEIWNLSLLTSFILGLCFSITSLPVVLRFMENNKIKDTVMGHTIIGTTVILEVLVLLLFGIVLNIGTVTGILPFVRIIAINALSMFAFFGGVMIVNKIFRSDFFSRYSSTLINVFKRLGDDGIFGVGVVFVLLFSTATEALGFHFIIGAFFGGLLLNKDILGVNAFASMMNTLNSVTRHFLTPIFFASIGLQFSITAFSDPLLLISVITFAYTAKILGSGIGARLARFRGLETVQVGVALNSKGTLDLIIAEIAVSKSYLSSQMFSILICTSLLALIVNPLMFKKIMPKNRAGAQGQT